ncbi:MAG TPA: DRTGG domain-containing protein, partial [Dehalococcoidia bacterium]|nr:DRTGG domain-containing protein [Dehalococcoidia bacterium]
PPGDVAEAAARTKARVLLVARGELDEETRRQAERLGGRLAGVVLTAVPEKEAQSAAAPVIAALPEDRLLAGPSVRDVRDALEARTLVEDGADAALEWVVVAPIASDPGAPYFTRWGRKAVVVRHEKADLMLAALGTELDCLIITGGREPLPYVLDRIRNEGRDLTVLLSPLDTYQTMRRIEKLYGASRFAGMRKVERAAELLRERLSVPLESLL